MEKQDIIIRQLDRNEIPQLRGMAPEEWNFDMAAFMACHYGEPYFYPIVAETSGRIVGVANAILNGSVGWLGNIIVIPEYRGRGIGRGLTESLMRHCATQRCRYQLLIATRMGEPLYIKLGFQVTSYYRFFKGPRIQKPPGRACLRPFESRDLDRILRLDRETSGERRGNLIKKFLSGGWVHHRSRNPKEIDGFYLHDFSAGLIIARNSDAGLCLLQLKHHLADKPAVAPEANQAACDFLLGNGYLEYLAAPRMALSGDVEWRPEYVFARGSGYCG